MESDPDITWVFLVTGDESGQQVSLCLGEDRGKMGPVGIALALNLKRERKRRTLPPFSMFPILKTFLLGELGKEL